MSTETNLYISVNSSRLGGVYQCHRFREYDIDLDLDTDADAFDFVFKNPNSVYTSLFSRFDKVDIYLNSKGIMKGIVDNVSYMWDDEDNYIRVSGRDIMSPIVDSHALPTTLQNVKPGEYIANKCKEYGIPNTKIDTDMSIVNKLVINISESEVSIMTKMIEDADKKMWLDYTTLHVSKWDSDAQPSYTLTRGVPVDKMCIPIKSLTVNENGIDVPSEYHIYGNNNGGKNGVLGKAQNDYMVNNGIKRRVVANLSDSTSKSGNDSKAMKYLREKFDESINVEIEIPTRNNIIKPNTTIWVIDMLTRINAIFFVRKVTYTKNAISGSITKIYATPSKSACDTLFASQGKKDGGVTGYAKMTFDELWNMRKG